MITYEMIAVFAVILFILIVLYKDWMGAGFTFLIGVSMLGVLQILSPTEILSGLANEQVMVVILMVVLSEVFRQTSLLDQMFDTIFKKTNTYNGFITRTALFLGGFSSIINNTPLVALSVPYAHTWAKRTKVSISKLLIPLSFLIMLGGSVTLIGTSTNLIVNGMIAGQKLFPAFKAFKMFDFTAVALPMLIIGFLYFRFFGNYLLPNRKPVSEDINLNTRRYSVEVQLKSQCPLIGKCIDDEGIPELESMILVEVIRNDQTIEEIPSKIIFKEDDILIFNAEPNAIAELVNTYQGFKIPSVGMFSKKRLTEVIEIVVTQNSSLSNKTLREENFRAKYEATALALHRNGEKLPGKPDSIRLKAGDAILLLTGNDFYNLASPSKDFYIISKIKEIRRLGFWRSFILIGGFFLVLILSILGLIKLFMGLVVLLSVIVIMKITTPRKLARHVDYEMGFIIVLSIALGTAMVKTGAAQLVAKWIISLFQGFGIKGLLTGSFLITSVMAAFINTRASVGIIFPIVMVLAKDMNLNPLPFALIVALASSANFMTPTGYATNSMIYGPGNYKFRDFLIVGTPLTIIYMIVTVFILSYIYF